MAIVAMNSFEALGLTISATAEEVKAAWRSAASRTHPDRGGDSAEFTRLRKAYEDSLAFAEAVKSCESCNGSGKIKQVHGWSAISMPCTLCNGSGLKQ